MMAGLIILSQIFTTNEKINKLLKNKRVRRESVKMV